jgi:outer membrane lipoprotein SlyB
MEISKFTDKITSKIKWDGIQLQKGNKTENVRIDGDSVEVSTAGSFVEGALKGVAVTLTGGSYPLIATAAKAVDGAFKTADKALKMGGDDKGTLIAGLKGALVGGVKGLAHGILDSMVIGGLSAAAIGLTGPLGFLLIPVIGGAYNVAKDAIRKSLGQTPNPHQIFSFEIKKNKDLRDEKFIEVSYKGEKVNLSPNELDKIANNPSTEMIISPSYKVEEKS